MSNYTSTNVVCRLLGGSGRAIPLGAPVGKIPALLRPSGQQPDVVALRINSLPLAA